MAEAASACAPAQTNDRKKVPDSPARRTRAQQSEKKELCLWEFANRLKYSDTTMVRPPPADQKLPAKDKKDFVNRCAMLEVAECNPGVFKKRTHLVATLQKYDEKTGKFFAQPYNQSGDKDGKAQAEEPGDLWVFPRVGSIVRVHPKGQDWEVDSYDVVNSTVFVKIPTKSADESPKKKPRRRRKHTSVQIPRVPKNTRKSKKKAMDTATTSSTADEDNVSEVYTLASVMQAFGNPRSNIILHVCTFVRLICCTNTHMTIIYECSYMSAHI